MSKKNKKNPKSTVSTKNQVRVPAKMATESAGKPKRRYHRRATVLHLFTLITCFSLFVFFSVKVATQSLMEQKPIECSGWVMTNNPETGKMEKKEFTVNMASATEMASLLDSTTSVYASEKMEKYGELNFRFQTSKRVRKFYISQDGVRDTQGWNRLKPVSLDKVHEILKTQKSVEMVNVAETIKTEKTVENTPETSVESETEIKTETSVE
ncbi:MAG: hypothetical protein Q4C70_02225 [Planctomycetia bacterium]|nr:hypothetical protein [Planctomycetia bacterium]